MAPFIVVPEIEFDFEKWQPAKTIQDHVEPFADRYKKKWDTIASAALDVGPAPDQMPTPAVAALPNVIATPHIGGLTPPAIEAQALNTVEQVRGLVSGALPEGAANSDRWTRRF